MSTESLTIQTIPYDFNRLYSPTARDFQERANREALDRLVSLSLLDAGAVDDSSFSAERTSINPVLFEKLGKTATGVSDEIERGLLVVLSGFGARENANPPRPTERSLGALATSKA